MAFKMWLFIYNCCAPFMVPPETLVTSNVFIWTTFIPSTFLTFPIFLLRALFVFRLTFVFCWKCKFRGTLTFLLLLGCLCPSSGVINNSNCMRYSFISLSAGLKEDPCLPQCVFIASLCVLWCVNPTLVLTPPLLHPILFSIFLCSQSAFLFSFASLSFLIFFTFCS